MLTKLSSVDFKVINNPVRKMEDLEPLMALNMRPSVLPDSEIVRSLSLNEEDQQSMYLLWSSKIITMQIREQ